jgi:hypothetical protein
MRDICLLATTALLEDEGGTVSVVVQPHPFLVLFPPVS